MEAKLADALETLFPTIDGKWADDGKVLTHHASTSDGRSVRFAIVRSIENYHAAVTCSNPDRHVSARHRIVFNLRTGQDRAEDVVSRFKTIIDAELGADFLRIVRYGATRL